MAEWLGNGLQNHVQQFDSAWHLFFFNSPFLEMLQVRADAEMPDVQSFDSSELS